MLLPCPPQECSIEEFNLWKNNREQTASVESSRLSLVDFLEQTLQQIQEYTVTIDQFYQNIAKSKTRFYFREYGPDK